MIFKKEKHLIKIFITQNAFDKMIFSIAKMKPFTNTNR